MSLLDIIYMMNDLDQFFQHAETKTTSTCCYQMCLFIFNQDM